MTKIPFDKIFVGLEVMFYFDDENSHEIGTVTKINDIHNVYVEGFGFNGLFCLDDTCVDYDPLFYTNSDERKLKLDTL